MASRNWSVCQQNSKETLGRKQMWFDHPKGGGLRNCKGKQIDDNANRSYRVFIRQKTLIGKIFRGNNLLCDLVVSKYVSTLCTIFEQCNFLPNSR